VGGLAATDGDFIGRFCLEGEAHDLTRFHFSSFNFNL
jgi:hypothetical protein